MLNAGEIFRGEAEATGTYAAAYGRDPEFYEFMRTLEAYRKTLSERTTLVLDPGSEFLRLLESAKPQ